MLVECVPKGVQVDVYAPLCVDGDHVMTAWTGYGPPPLVAPVPVHQTATPAGAEKRFSAKARGEPGGGVEVEHPPVGPRGSLYWSR